MKPPYPNQISRPNRIKKLLIISILFTLLSSIITQYLAYTFKYQASLTGAIIEHTYQPFAWIEWHIDYYTEFKEIFLEEDYCNFNCYFISKLEVDFQTS